MALRRMFSLKITDTDAFCEMPVSAQLLYFHIGMRADDDGLYASVRGLMLKIHSSVDDLNVLIARGFILDRGDGVFLIKHWKMNNYLQKDRYTPTAYPEKLVGVFIKNDGVYTLDSSQGKPALKCDVSKMYTQDSIVKDSVGKYSIVENRERIEESSFNSKGLQGENDLRFEIETTKSFISMETWSVYRDNDELKNKKRKCLLNKARELGIELTEEQLAWEEVHDKYVKDNDMSC